MPKVKFTEYKGYQITHGPLFKRIMDVDGPYIFYTVKEAKKYIDENLLKDGNNAKENR